MAVREQKYVIIDGRLNKESEIESSLWALQDTRRRTISELIGLTPAVIDWLPPNDESSIGTVLYHLALIEADWLCEEVLEQEFPQQILPLFLHEHRDQKGHLTQLKGLSLEQHLERLETVRGLLMEAFQPMSLKEFRRIRQLANYDVTPEWVLHHLMKHEAEHRSQIGSLRAAAERQPAAG